MLPDSAMAQRLERYAAEAKDKILVHMYLADLSYIPEKIRPSKIKICHEKIKHSPHQPFLYPLGLGPVPRYIRPEVRG